jgi:hypothetical protein
MLCATGHVPPKPGLVAKRPANAALATLCLTQTQAEPCKPPPSPPHSCTARPRGTALRPNRTAFDTFFAGAMPSCMPSTLVSPRRCADLHATGKAAFLSPARLLRRREPFGSTYHRPREPNSPGSGGWGARAEGPSQPLRGDVRSQRTLSRAALGPPQPLESKRSGPGRITLPVSFSGPSESRAGRARAAVLVDDSCLGLRLGSASSLPAAFMARRAPDHRHTAPSPTC